MQMFEYGFGSLLAFALAPARRGGATWVRRFCSIRSLLVMAAVGLPALLLTGCRQQRTKEEMLEGVPPEMQRLLEPMQSTPLVVDGIEAPRMLSADAVDLEAGHEVIGVTVADQPRAYSLAGMSGMMEHVVNDHIVDDRGEPQAFTVTYCDLTDCVRVLESVEDSPRESLGVGILGMLDGGLALRWQDQQFKQADEVVGLQDVPHERTTWGEWKRQNPGTQVYVGSLQQGVGDDVSIKSPGNDASGP